MVTLWEMRCDQHHLQTSDSHSVLNGVQIWDASAQLEQLAAIAADAEETSASVHLAPRHMHKHASEGYALDWSPVSAGRLASGDCTSAIHVWEPAPGGRWVVSQSYKGHSDSVEDIQWSPTELTVFASCSVDRSIRIWDTRDSSKSQLEMAAAHNADVNVISWNRLTSYTLASGGDDGGLRVWDLRHLSTFVANLAYHKYASCRCQSMLMERSMCPWMSWFINCTRRT